MAIHKSRIDMAVEQSKRLTNLRPNDEINPVGAEYPNVSGNGYWSVMYTVHQRVNFVLI